MIRPLIILALMAVTAPAVARPVSYVGGWTFIEETDRQATSALFHYTVTPKLSVGVRSEWDRKMDFQLHAAQATYLINRWYGEDYQANIYAFAGAGVADGVSSNPANANAAGFIGALADWETRRLFASYRTRYIDAGDVGSAFFQAARIGFAPYVGDTGDLHTWIMVEVDHRPQNDDEVGVTPLVRFLKGAALLEAGWSLTDNEPLVNFTYRF